MSLLEKAREIAPQTEKSRGKLRLIPLPERLELALAYVNGEISGCQLAHALDKLEKNRGSLYHFIATSLSDAIRKGLLVKNGNKEAE